MYRCEFAKFLPEITNRSLFDNLRLLNLGISTILIPINFPSTFRSESCEYLDQNQISQRRRKPYNNPTTRLFTGESEASEFP